MGLIASELGMRSAVVSAWLLAGCFGTGSLDLELTMPTEMDLKPTGMSTITVLASSPEIGTVANRTVLTGSSFKAGELPVSEDVQINVLLHDVSNRLVGLGEAPELVDIVGDEKTTLTIPVRRPFIYAAGSSGTATSLYTFDPTLDPRDMKFQGKLAGLATPQVAISVGGDLLVVGGGNQLQQVDTATHKVTGMTVTLPAALNDVAPVPSEKRVVAATAMGISIVDLATAQVTNAMVGPVDRVAVGPAADGRMVAYGLVGRVPATDLPPPLGTCMGSSSIVAVFIDAPAVTAPKPLGAAVSAIAASPSAAKPNAGAVYAALPCTNQVVRIDGDPTSEVAQLTLVKLSDLKNAAAIAVQGDRVWAAGTEPSTPSCLTGPCTATSSLACPETTNARVSYVDQGARLAVQSIPAAGGPATTVVLPERRETMIDTMDPSHQHAQVLHPLTSVPLDLVTLPGGQYVAIVMKNSYFIDSTFDGLQYILPCLKVSSADWLLVDMASSSIGQRVRPHCMITNMRQGAYFSSWACDDPPEAETAKQGDFTPLSVGALFGAR